MLILNLIKGVVTLGTSIGSGATVKYLVEAVTPVESIKPITRVALKLSTLVIGAAVAELTANYIESQIDGAIEGIQSVKESIVKAKEEATEFESETSTDE